VYRCMYSVVLIIPPVRECPEANNETTEMVVG